MIIISHGSDVSEAQVSAALASGFAVELRRGEPARFMDSGEHVIELDALGDRLADVLPIESRPVVRPDLPDLPPTFPYATPFTFLPGVSNAHSTA